MIDNPQVVRVANNVIRPAADALARLITLADQFADEVAIAEVLGPLGITPEMLAAPALPDPADYPEDVIADGADKDGRPIATNLELLQFARIVLQFKGLADAEQYGIPGYVRRVTYGLAVNPGG